MIHYKEIEQNLQQEYYILKSKKSKLGNIRLGFFALGSLLFYFYVTSTNNLYLTLSILFFVTLIILIIKTYKIVAQLEYTTQALEIIQQIKLDDTTDLFVTDNDKFDNIFNKDLDILEENSLFNRINKTQTRIGSLQLKDFLSIPLLNREEIINRQKSFAELAKKHDWIIKFLTYAKRLNINETSIFKYEKRVFVNLSIRFIPLIISIINFSIFLYLIISKANTQTYFYWLLVAFIVGFLINFIFKKQIRKVSAYTTMKADELINLFEIFNHIEKEDFEAYLNKNIQQKFNHQNKKSSELIKAISLSKEAIEASYFPLVGFILDNLFLWRLYYSIQFEDRIQRTVEPLEPWLEELSKMEAFISFAIFNNKFQNFNTPIIVEQPFLFELKDAYHPLLKENKATKNSFENQYCNNIAIITGANMAGKSTFLRTVGINLVLAMNGANVSANEMKFYPMELFTSIRTVDNLSSGDSYFKNEINKLRILIDRLESNRPQFIILDEILKGTNSEDKLIGSRKFLEKLIKSPTKLIGFIATHDLELTKMEIEYPNHITNYCFELKNVNNQYFSDYILRKGTTKTMNALYLMKQFNIID